MSEFRRQHPVAAIAQLLGLLRQNIPTLVILIFVGTKNAGDYFWPSLLAGIIIAFGLGFGGWFRFTFRVHNQELQIKKGIFVRKKLYLSRDRIQVIDITEGLLQRVFGLVKVEIKSAGGGTEKATISAITRQEADELQVLLREGSKPESTAEFDKPEVTPQPASYPSWRLSGRDLFFAALTSGNFGVIASILGAGAGQLDQFLTEENLEYLYDRLPGFSQLSVILWMIFFVVLVSYLLSFVGVILRYSDFKIQKKEKELLITSGLLERKNITVPFNRIQAIRFVEGITRQPLGYGMLYVESAGFEQKDKNRSIVLVPFIRKSEVATFFQGFVPEIGTPKQRLLPPKRAMFRFIRRPNYLLVPAVSLLWFFWPQAWFLYLLIIPAALYGWLQYKDAQVLVDDEQIQITSREIAKTTAYVRKNRVQVVEVSINPFQKRKLLANVTVTAASGAGGKHFAVQNMDVHDAQMLYDWTLSRALPTSQISINVLETHQIADVKELLAGYNLPVEDLETSPISFYGAFTDGVLLGSIGMEKKDRFGLLRSLAVTPSQKGKGVGSQLVGFVEAAAREEEITELFLLTETAQTFFEQLGYSKISRALVPEPIQGSSEFSTLCPQTAVVMQKKIA